MPDIDQRKLSLLTELEELLSLKRKSVCSGSFREFVKVYLPHLTPNTTPDFHLEMFSLLERTVSEKDRINRLLEIAPRGFGKSRVNSIFFVLWLAVFGKKKDIFMVSATISLSKELLLAVRTELECNEKIKRDFGDLKSDKWTEEHLILSNGTHVRAKGRGFQIRGFRPDIVICDDLEDEEVIYSKEQRDKMENWFFRTLLPALKPSQAIVYVGTMIHQFSLISKLKAKPEFVVRHWQALRDDKSLWEELFPAGYLIQLRQEIGEYAFQAEYQNNPISLEEQPVKAHMLDGVKLDPAIEESVLAFDPAISEKQTSDYRAICIIGRTKDGFRELYSDRGRWGVTEQAEKIVDLYVNYKKQFNIKRVVLEEVAYQRVFREILKDKAKEKGVFIPIATAELGSKDDKRPKDKVTRLMEIVHLFEQRAVEISNPLLYQELLGFPFGEHDDMVDACVYALRYLVDAGEGRYILKRDASSVIKDIKKAPALVEVRPGVWQTQYADQPKPKLFSNFFNFDK